MRILIIGGTQLTGPFLTRKLLETGHRVTVYHRGNYPGNVPTGVDQIMAPREVGRPDDRLYLRRFADQFRAIRADVVIHMIAFTRADAEVFVQVFSGFAGRVVVASSSDVYRASGIINRTEPGPPIPVPIDESGPLRTKPFVHGVERDKRGVEEIVLGAEKLQPVVLRYPAIYGPGTYRRNDWIKRMLDRRPAILIGKGEAAFRFTHGYAQDVAWATALAATRQGRSRIYNVGELETPCEGARLERFARVAGWNGRIVEVADEIIPGGDGGPFPGQDWLLDTARIRRELGYSEIADIDQGIRATIDWQESHPNPQLNTQAFNYAAEDALLARL